MHADLCAWRVSILKRMLLSKNALCSILGVVQMVNKHSGTFDSTDEQNFECFAVYCGLALHHAKVTVAIATMVCSSESAMQLYDKIRRSEQKYRVALEVLAYHSVCNREEIAKIKQKPMPDRIMALERCVVEATIDDALFHYAASTLIHSH